MCDACGAVVCARCLGDFEGDFGQAWPLSGPCTGREHFATLGALILTCAGLKCCGHDLFLSTQELACADCAHSHPILKGELLHAKVN